MATVNGSAGYDYDGRAFAQWSGFAASGDAGSPVSVPAHARDLSIQLSGTISGSLSVALQGSTDGVAYSAMKDTGGTLIALTDNTVIKISNLPKFVKPVATAGSGGANAVVIISGSTEN